MKILHTSDWHLGKKLEQFSRHEEQIEVLHEIEEIANKNKVDAILIAGDIFDTFNPPVESLELLYKSLRRLSLQGKRPIIAIAGNHDSPDRIESPDALAKELGIFLIGYPETEISPFKNDAGLEITQSAPGFIEFLIPGQNAPLRILTTPYANEYRLKKMFPCDDDDKQLIDYLKEDWETKAEKYCDNKGINILVSHMLFMGRNSEVPEESEEEKSILHIGGLGAIPSDIIPKQIQYTALGHIHGFMNLDKEKNIIYSGSPLQYSFSEAGREKSITIANINPGEKANIEKTPLISGKQLVRKHFTSVDDCLVWLNNNPDCLLEISVETDTYLTAEERKNILTAHEGIISLIPQPRNKDNINTNQSSVDIQKDITSLFKDYFKSKKGQEPNEEIIDLFNEIKSK